MSPAPPVTDAPIEIADYDPGWAEAFEAERRVLSRVLAPWLAGPPEHIGSTAVAGLAAKPIVDIMVPVRTLVDSRPAIAAAAALGYVYFPYQAEVMHWFCKPSPAVRTHHLHLVPLGSRLWNERLAFREALRADDRLRAEYRLLKLDLAARYRHDREGYTEAKSPFIRRVLERARRLAPTASEQDRDRLEAEVALTSPGTHGSPAPATPPAPPAPPDR